VDKILCVSLCFNQANFIQKKISLLKDQTYPCDILFVNDSNVDIQIEDVIIINNHQNIGRSASRNKAINYAIENNYDIIIFTDGDCFPISNKFVECYINEINKLNYLSFLYGMRLNVRDKNIEVTRYPMCVSQANLGVLPENYNLDDPRVITHIVDEYNKGNDLYRLDMLSTGKIAWSCNFACNVKALEEKNLRFDEINYPGWGYEDIDFSVRAWFQNIEIHLTDIKDIYVSHILHDTAKEDDFVYHYQGQHKIMNLYRKLLNKS
jgi:glycosyltransferase involved in cell wall biosynthesis